MEETIRNRVAESPLLQIDMEEWYDHSPRRSFDLADFLFQGLILKELDFRQAMKNYDWESIRGAVLSVYCSADAIVPHWAFMLVATYASPIAGAVLFCTPDRADELLFDRKIQSLSLTEYLGKKVIVKGCSKFPVPVSAYLALSDRLIPVVQSLMFGEPCSNVPLYKKKQPASSQVPAA
jgi:hypothetical protein